MPKEEREVDDEMVNALKEKEKVEIIECSAKENINVNEAFISLIDKMIELGLGKRRTSSILIQTIRTAISTTYAGAGVLIPTMPKSST